MFFFSASFGLSLHFYSQCAALNLIYLTEMLQLKYWFRKGKQKWFFNFASSSANGKWLSINLWQLEELRLLMKSDCLFDQCLYNCYWRDLVVKLQFPLAQIHLNKTVDMDKYNLRNYFFLQHIYFKASYILKLNLLIIFECYSHH